jgi:glycosyltransferase involved in cell wall biosynthesis
MKKRIAVVSEFSDLGERGANGRFTYIARALSGKYDVTLFTSDFDHTTKSHRAVSGVAMPFGVRLVNELGYDKNVGVKRLRSHKRYGKNLYESLMKEDAFDLIYCAVPSTSQGLAALKYSSERHIPFIVDIQDIWPEAFELVFHVPVVSDMVFAPMRRAIDGVYTGADAIVAVSQTYADVGMKYRAKIRQKDINKATVVFLGTDLARFDSFLPSQTEAVKPDGEIWVAYIGTLGHSYNINVITDALAELKGQGIENVVFKVMGDGPLMGRFEEHAADAGIRADFLGRLPYPEMVRMLHLSDIAVNPIMPGAAQSIINKVGDYAAAGLPVVNTQDNAEYRALVDEYNVGYNCDNDGVTGIADAIAALVADIDLRRHFGANNRRLAEDRFDRSRTYPEIYELIDDLLGA